jgi:hypothetical protein
MLGWKQTSFTRTFFVFVYVLACLYVIFVWTKFISLVPYSHCEGIFLRCLGMLMHVHNQQCLLCTDWWCLRVQPNMSIKFCTKTRNSSVKCTKTDDNRALSEPRHVPACPQSARPQCGHSLRCKRCK